ncbi:hypothetical protein BO83DRAFT_182477 [Aspergillus eucalypticola CBS 122712]|uniref:Uncharacterized protein n=1 Tax=Aspergillus eucalypticola (strain CBS 122712 / IBT 29274) TaxID=1448314 RepID=A0A317UNU5_ASPEC|nr:uncharacterized protein BO83DRAFT_182477 [Aspergillus eucalypticola CBS 122712]PWY62846.1 hypothetical protein BO83DRAFT_182477 [Aspergillus eucalypticola CBS 122712]
MQHVVMAHIDSKEPPFHATLHYDTVHETERELSGISTWREPEGSKLIIDAWLYPSAPSFLSTCGVLSSFLRSSLLSRPLLKPQIAFGNTYTLLHSSLLVPPILHSGAS